MSPSPLKGDTRVSVKFKPTAVGAEMEFVQVGVEASLVELSWHMMFQNLPHLASKAVIASVLRFYNLGSSRAAAFDARTDVHSRREVFNIASARIAIAFGATHVRVGGHRG